VAAGFVVFFVALALSFAFTIGSAVSGETRGAFEAVVFFVVAVAFFLATLFLVVVLFFMW
jgi:hypothetical protein